MNLDQKLNLRLDIYFSLTKKQRRKLSETGHSHINFDSTMSIEQFQSITKSKRLLDSFIRLKYSSGLKLVS